MSGSWRADRGAWIVDRGARLVVAVAVGALMACGGAPEESPERAGSRGEPAAGRPAAATADGVGVQGAWVRVAIMPDGGDGSDAPPVNSAAYMVLTNPSDADDALVAVETEIADTAEVHSVTMDDGIMRMRPVDSVPVPAGGQAVLEQGGYHIMLIGLRRPLAEGDSVPLRLRLRSGAVLDLTAPVLRSPPM